MSTAVPDRHTEDVPLVDLLDRLLAGGVVLTGDVVLGVADVDLVHLHLRVLLSSVDTLAAGGDAAAGERA